MIKKEVEEISEGVVEENLLKETEETPQDAVEEILMEVIIKVMNKIKTTIKILLHNKKMILVLFFMK